MQMSTGTTSLIARRSYMEKCKPGQPCEAQLPGSDLSLSDFPPNATSSHLVEKMRLAYPFTVSNRFDERQLRTRKGVPP